MFKNKNTTNLIPIQRLTHYYYKYIIFTFFDKGNGHKLVIHLQLY